MKALIIDDNEEITTATSFYLESINISCKVINEGKEGLDAIKKEHFDIVFLDLAMPEFSGYDILKVLYNEGLLKSNNIIIFTASSVTDNDIEEMLSLGAKSVLKKPLSIQELQATVDKFR
jgi:DNA-binding response OmpR family regulator